MCLVRLPVYRLHRLAFCECINELLSRRPQAALVSQDQQLPLPSVAILGGAALSAAMSSKIFRVVAHDDSSTLSM